MTPTNLTRLAIIAAFSGLASQAWALGVYSDGADASSAARAGLNVTAADSLLAISQGNPAALSRYEGLGQQLSLSVPLFSTDYSSLIIDSESTRARTGLIPAYAQQLHTGEKFRVAFSLMPDVALRTDYRMLDVPGGAGGVSWGVQDQQTLMLAISANAVASWQVYDELSLGLRLGLIYNRNELKAPYIFQANAPAPVVGLKPLVDLSTDGWGVIAQFGALLQPADHLSIGFSHQPQVDIDTSGKLTGDLSAQLNQLNIVGVNPLLAYDLDIEAALPARTSLGVSWDFGDDRTVHGQIEWVDNARAYDSLDLHLSNGQNTDVNGLIGSDSLVEYVPLNWDDQQIARIAYDFPMARTWEASIGFAWAEQPVPAGTLTPLNAPIQDRVFSFGARRDDFAGGSLSLSYQRVDAKGVTVGTSDLLAGEYDNSRFDLGGHWFRVDYSW